jgi:hypothetical protein
MPAFLLKAWNLICARQKLPTCQPPIKTVCFVFRELHYQPCFMPVVTTYCWRISHVLCESTGKYTWGLAHDSPVLCTMYLSLLPALLGILLL